MSGHICNIEYKEFEQPHTNTEFTISLTASDIRLKKVLLFTIKHITSNKRFTTSSLILVQHLKKFQILLTLTGFFLTPSHILADLFEKTSTLFYNLEASKITHLCSGSQSKSHLIATLT